MGALSISPTCFTSALFTKPRPPHVLSYAHQESHPPSPQVDVQQNAANSPGRSLFAHLASNFCNTLEELIPLPPHSINTYLSSNFAPLFHESPPTPCPHIEGVIPLSLNGVFLRNGPNPLHLPNSDYHYFDGDGMIHAVTINNGHAVHACRYIRTNRFVHEHIAKKPLFVKPIGELHGIKGIAKLFILVCRHIFGIIDISKGFGAANAGLVYFNGKVLAMSEDDMPYCIHLSNDGDIHTVGRFDFGGKLKSSMCAHPKVDPTCKEMFSFAYNLLMPPYLKYFRATCNGEKLKDVPITIKEPTLMHDFAITKSYAIFYEHQIVFRLHNMIKGGSPIVVDTKKRPKVGILPKYDTSEANMQWFQCSHNFGTCMHFYNAWEEGDDIVMVGCVSQPLELIFSNLEKIESRLTKFTFNLKTGKSHSEQVSHANIDMGRVNENYIGRKTRFVYLCTSGPWPKYSGVCKVDLEAPCVNQVGAHTDEPCIVGGRIFGEKCYGSEPFFVPRSSDPSLLEDDGYLLTYVHDEEQNSSKLLIMDAQSPSLAIIATITMPTRVPYGFHSLFVSAPYLRNQDKGLNESQT